ncbi:MAG: hypothetical protein PHV85_09105 [Desulfovibrionaceae bacterium]|nr:hypothetical protein [Desulfovibrionaceae bacterium]
MKTAARGQDPRDIPRHVKDPEFLLRGNPEFPEHDQLGFRNRSVPRRAPLLVVGDSQVYGACVRAEQCWPFLLAAGLEGGVYNAAMEGWGAVQYAMITDELLGLAPDQVIVALYAGNDIYESFLCARRSTSRLAGSFWDPAFEDLAFPDLSVKQASDRAVDRAFEAAPEAGQAEVLAEMSRAGVPDCGLAEIEASRFYLTENFRLAVQDQAQPAICAGFKIAERALAHLGALSRNYGFGLSALLVPTREYLVYTRLSEARVRDRETLVRLGRAEQETLARLAGACENLGIAAFDLSEHLKHYIGARIFPQDSRDGHPNAKGCRIIAEYVKTRVLPKMQKQTARGIYPLY